MMLNEFPVFACEQNKKIDNQYLYSKLAMSLLLTCFLIADVSADPVENKYYLRIAHNNPSDTNDLDITSIGMLSFTDNLNGSIDFTHVDSDKNGQALALELGGGYAYTGDVSLYLSFGVSLGYNWDNDDYIASYFPEAGIVLDFTKSFGITVSGKRYFNLYGEDENIVMLGLLFRS
jgi:hypothetical protein